MPGSGYKKDMGRIHLFELEDQSWFPGVLRDAGTAYLRKAPEVAGQTKLLVAPLMDVLKRTGVREIVDLCSGGAGPLPSLVPALAEEGVDVHVKLTDLYPNDGALDLVCEQSEGRIDRVREPVDATDVPRKLVGLRTMFNGLHHFRPEAARAILADAVEAGQPFGAFELVARHPLVILGILFSPIPVMLMIPFLRPFRWSWLLFTYVIPLIPLFVIWDGVVSCLRVYSEAELRALSEGLEKDGYRFEVGRFKLEPLPVYSHYIVGIPPSDAA